MFTAPSDVRRCEGVEKNGREERDDDQDIGGVGHGHLVPQAV
jgi:hypothetical protein